MKTLFLLSFLVLAGCASPQWKQIDAGRRFLNERNMPTAARKNFENAVEISTQKKDPYALAVAYQEIGFTYLRAEHDFVNGKEYFNKAIEISEPHKFHYLLAELFYNSANICNAQKAFLKQEKFPPACLKHGCGNLNKSRDAMTLAKSGNGKPPQSEKPESIRTLEMFVDGLWELYKCEK